HERQRYTADRVGLRAVGACEPRQVREEAALSIPSQVRDQPGPYSFFVSSAIRNSGRRLTSSYMRPTYWPRMPRKTSCAPPSSSTAAVTDVQPCTARSVKTFTAST